MLSRLAVRSDFPAMVPRCLAGARELATTPALAERDLVNFPPRQRPIERGPVKALIFPAEWFDALYPKTGVTGPYMALFGVSTFLASKEYFVMEHDFYVGIGLAIVMTYLIKTQGPAYTEAINKQLDEEEAALKAIRQDEIDACLAQIKGEQGVQEQATAWQDIIAAKKEAVGLQDEICFYPTSIYNRKVLCVCLSRKMSTFLKACLSTMVFQGGLMVFHDFWLVSMVFKVVSWFFMVVSWFFMVFGWFPWFFKLVSWFFMVFGWFPWFFKLVSWFFMVFGWFP